MDLKNLLTKKKVFFVEGIHSFGLCLLVFRILPSCDIIRAVLLMNSMCLIPAFCKMIFSKNNVGTVGKALIIMIDLLALIAQATAFFVVMGTQYTAFIEKANVNLNTPMSDAIDPFASPDGLTIGNNPSFEKPKWKTSWEAPFAIFLTSISWWENYVDRDFKFGCFRIPLASYKRHLQSIRSKANIGASLWKIALTITFSVVMLPSKKFENAFVKMPFIPDAVPINPINMNMNDIPVARNSFDFKNTQGHVINKRDDDMAATTIAMISQAMNLESVLTVPNNAWNTPTTPNMYETNNNVSD